ncbi:hypothetical protein POM88_036823 [Heracleum sosnowskyi]|uniref:Uncharacterized protein n=1 Tax=Heracleum sosnowskyi TaxID=360622 RepID=A0AAD8HP62_9APIA|nr:hypothetical protein POM88_036823 [Heracleum sosnowskyi]
MEAKIQGLSLSEVKLQVANCDVDDRLYCNNCKTSIVDFHRSCANCLYDLCLICCRELLKFVGCLLDGTRFAESDDRNYKVGSGDEDSSQGMKRWILEYHNNRPGVKILQDRIDDFIVSHEAKLEQAFFFCYYQRANLRGALLAGANLQSANLQDACLIDCSFCGADLRSAHLHQLIFDLHQDEYNNEDDLGELECGHNFHKERTKNWPTPKICARFATRRHG